MRQTLAEPASRPYTDERPINGKIFRAYRETFFDTQDRKIKRKLVVEELVPGGTVVNTYTLRSDQGDWHLQLVRQMSADFHSVPNVEGKEELLRFLSDTIFYLRV